LFVLAILLGCLGFSNNIFSQKEQYPTAIKGIIDLRGIDLQKESVPLNGEWGMYWKQLLAPDETKKQAPAYVAFPKLFNNTKLNGTKLSTDGYATYTATVLLPKHSNRLALQVPDTYCSYRLFVNGTLFCQSGIPDSLEEKAVPKWIENTVEIWPARQVHSVFCPVLHGIQLPDDRLPWLCIAYAFT